MTGTDTASRTAELHGHFRKWIGRVEVPLSRYEQDVDREESLVIEDRQALGDGILETARKIEAALDLEQIPQAVRHGLYLLVLRPDSPDALDEIDDNIIDRLIGQAIRSRHLEDLIFYAQAMGGGEHATHDVRLRHMAEILQAIKDAGQAQGGPRDALTD